MEAAWPVARDKRLGVTYWVTPMARAATEAPIAHPLQRRICAAKFCIPALSIHQLAEPLSTAGGGLLRMVGDAIAYLNRLPKHGETSRHVPDVRTPSTLPCRPAGVCDTSTRQALDRPCYPPAQPPDASRVEPDEWLHLPI